MEVMKREIPHAPISGHHEKSDIGGVGVGVGRCAPLEDGAEKRGRRKVSVLQRSKGERKQ